MEINCAKLCMLFIVQIRMEMTVQSCARMEMGVVHDVIYEVLALMGGDYDIIDCYDITEVPMMSFMRFWL